MVRVGGEGTTGGATGQSVEGVSRQMKAKRAQKKEMFTKMCCVRSDCSLSNSAHRFHQVSCRAFHKHPSSRTALRLTENVSPFYF